VHDHTGDLVEYQQLVVFKNDVEWNVFRQDVGLAGWAR